MMGIGPRVAIPLATAAAGIDVDDVDIFEINEAFASQALMSVRDLGIDRNKVNVNGGRDNCEYLEADHILFLAVAT